MYANLEKDGRKFWRIQLDPGKGVIIRFGPLGRTGQTTNVPASDPEREFHKRLNQKVKEGYRIVEQDAGSKPLAEPSENDIYLTLKKSAVAKITESEIASLAKRLGLIVVNGVVLADRSDPEHSFALAPIAGGTATGIDSPLGVFLAAIAWRCDEKLTMASETIDPAKVLKESNEYAGLVELGFAPKPLTIQTERESATGWGMVVL